MTAWLILLAGSFFFLARRTLRYLRYLQQEDYDPSRFVHWIWKHRAFDRRATLAIVFSGIAYLFLSQQAFFVLTGVLLASIALFEGDPCKKGKLPLQMTSRARRIYFTALAMAVALAILFTSAWIGLLLLVQMPPLFLMLATCSLAPGEKRRQKKLLAEAQKRWSAVASFTIGITGSYGKTSTKHILGELLQTTLGATFWPQQGINTPMGITREIRTRLQNHTPYAVIEMGAYGKGSIRRLCELTPPHAGIITGIGVAHLDRFGSEEAIRLAKGELAQAIPKGGILVCNGDNARTRLLAMENPNKETHLYGFDNSKNDLACWIKDYAATPEGSTFVLEWHGGCYTAKTPLLGKHAISNIAAAFTMACALGAQPAFLIGAMAHLHPVRNRLEIATEREVTYLHDAYNSNPEGFSSALETLAAIPAKKRVLMTPGMIELAEQNHKQHERIGRQAAQVCDLAIIVGDTNRDSLSEGLLAGGMSPQNILVTATREEAFELLRNTLSAGDAVLIENDLPDLYESEERF